jgi:hypothetical protein
MRNRFITAISACSASSNSAASAKEIEEQLQIFAEEVMPANRT